jgi:prephenate dehydrogenase
MTGVAVVGLGLIGGSIALGARARGWDRDAAVREGARRRGIDAADSLEDAVAGATLAVAAVPTAEAPGLLREIARLAPNAILTDCASLKAPVAGAAATLPAGARFVAGHPMAGRRGRGVAAADPAIFRDRPWALVRTARSDDASFADVEAFVRSFGARPLAIDAERHDRAMTWVSHLPLAVSAALARAATSGGGEDVHDLAGPGLLDATRLAAGPPALALELVLGGGGGALADAIALVRDELSRLAAALSTRDADTLRAFFEEAEAVRRSLEGDRSTEG